MKNTRSTSRPLTIAEQKRVDAAIASVEENEDALRDEAREIKAVSEDAALIVQNVVSQLKAERLRQGLTLADIQERSMLQASAVSRLETDPHSNPTLLTLQRYAAALGGSIGCELERDSSPAI